MNMHTYNLIVINVDDIRENQEWVYYDGQVGGRGNFFGESYITPVYKIRYLFIYSFNQTLTEGKAQCKTYIFIDNIRYYKDCFMISCRLVNILCTCDTPNVIWNKKKTLKILNLI